MNKAIKIVGILGALTLVGCGSHQSQQVETEVTQATPTGRNIVSGSLAQARQDPKDRLFSCYYEINGRVSKAYPKRMKTCPATIYINTDTNDVTFGR